MRKFMQKFLKTTWLYDELRVIRGCVVAFHQFDVKGSLSLYLKIRTCHRKYGWYPNEYFLYNYESLSEKERESFVSEIEHVRFAKTVNSLAIRKLLSNKWRTFDFYKRFFHREACMVTPTNNGWGRYNELISKNKRLILKPLLGTYGIGIKIVTQEDGDTETLLKWYPRGFIAEELIVQDERMAQLHPESVNTLRIHTLQNKGVVEVFHPYIRMGRGTSVVDNGGSGGIFTSCNPETGEVLSAVDESGHRFSHHPDTNFALIGFTVPCWKEAYDFAKQLALANQEIHCVGWDLALTKDGWVLIEGNTRPQMIFQISEQKGFKKELIDICDKLGFEYPEK